MKQKRILRQAAAMALAVMLALAGCGSPDESTASSVSGSTASATTADTSAVTGYFAAAAEYSGKDLDAAWDAAESTGITLEGDAVTVAGEGASASGSVVTISAAGTYVISGTLTNGQIIVAAGEEDFVHIVLNGVSVACENDAPLYVKSADKVVLTLADGTQNTFSDSGAFDTASEDAPAATIYSRDDLTLNGEGALTVTGQCGGGIACNDALKIVSGDIEVTSAGDALKGNDCVAIRSGNIALSAGADGIESTNAEEAGKGYVAIEGGTVVIDAALDGVQAETCALLSGGDISVTSGGGSENSSFDSDEGDWGNWGGQQQAATDEASAKGIKAGIDVTVSGGTLTVDSSDDALHSGGSITISGGDIAISSGDDGAHADVWLAVSGSSVAISKSYEGIESAAIAISGGEVRISAADDGINTAGGNDESSTGGRPGQNGFNGMNSGSNPLTITGGWVYVDADGDGIDVNGSITMTAGTVLVCGPTDDANGALDFVSFDISGGLLIAAGSSGMALAPDDTSSQTSVMVTLDTAQSADTLLALLTEDGDALAVFKPCKQYVNVVISTPDIAERQTLTLSTGGVSTGSDTDGFYADGSYSGGTEQESFTVSGIVTTVGSAGNMGGQGGMGGRGGRG